jgi:SSS family solute:Na+ symporter
MNLNWIDFVVIAVYFAGLFLFGLLVRRIRNFADYAIGGKSVPSAMIFASLAATYIGPGYTLGFASKGFSSGFLFFFVAMAFTLQTLLVGIFVAPRLHRYENCFTVGDVMGRVFGKPAQLATGIITLLLSIGFVAIMGKVGGLVLQGSTGLPLVWGVALVTFIGVVYTFTGGIKSVIATDSMQFSIFAIGIPVLLFVVWFKSGVNLAAASQSGWNAARISLREMGGLQALGLFLSFFLGETLIPPYANRALAAGTDKMATTGFVTAAGYSVVWFGMVVVLGVLGRAIIPNAGPDDIFMTLTTSYLPHGMIGLIIVAITAVIMSSQESVLNAGSVSFTRDLVRPLSIGLQSDRAGIGITRAATVVVGVIATIAAVKAPSIIDGLLIIYSLWAPSVLPVFLLGILLPKPSRNAGLPAMLAGAVSSVIWQFALNSPGGVPAILIGLIANLIVYIIVSLIARSYVTAA